ncbi:MAG: YraN family protein [Faecalibacterium sp.]
MSSAQLGQRGEAAAARYYQKQGYALITHHFCTRMGELDLILRGPDGMLVFCEVKTRSPGALARPAAAVDAGKQRRLIRTAQIYLQQTGQSDVPMRFDVAEVIPLDSGRWMVHIIKSAFLCTE